MTDIETVQPSQERVLASIDTLAPDFEARTTMGPIRLSDHRGRWVVLFSHPADFTPVCTSEFIAFQNAAGRFEALNCRLMGLSVDSLFAHLAWVRDIDARFGVRIGFPIIEDMSMAISRAYGMVHEGSSSTAAVRSVFFIDPEGYVRAIVHYPLNVGRSVAEIVRVLSALQETDAHPVSTPEGWKPGDRAVLPPPLTMAEADDRDDGQAGAAWYYTAAGEAS
ncbi:peroxiredoxin [Aquisalinus flavus]|uniref:Peroxiredoxin n=1 Tax=Aquisalinus flavus TaxID=1526572 RepID=A0A8J2V5Z4_9PROT|nr:peroxiredoxin [Aquisalinus flavus]GGD07613.1 peroxiredoxin [Aquisalinus flavus]